jgi:hypothetical protein
MDNVPPPFLSSTYVQQARMVDPKPGNGMEPEKDAVSLTYSGRLFALLAFGEASLADRAKLVHSGPCPKR